MQVEGPFTPFRNIPRYLYNRISQSGTEYFKSKSDRFSFLNRFFKMS